MDPSGTPPQYMIVDRLGAFFYWTRFIRSDQIRFICDKGQLATTVRQYHSDLSDQSALQIRVRIRDRLRVALL